MMNYSKYLGSNKSDEKYTPHYAVLPIIKYLPPKAKVWCPFDTGPVSYTHLTLPTSDLV